MPGNPLDYNSRSFFSTLQKLHTAIFAELKSMRISCKNFLISALHVDLACYKGVKLCDQICVSINATNHLCRCFPGYQMDKNGNSCVGKLSSTLRLVDNCMGMQGTHEIKIPRFSAQTLKQNDFHHQYCPHNHY